jgi:Zn-dependent M28 family amino/carboxypeptidase
MSRPLTTLGLVLVLIGLGFGASSRATRALPSADISTATAPAMAQATAAATASGGTPRFDGQQAFKHAEAQVNFGVRPTGSDASIKTGDYIIARLREYGWNVTEQPFVLDISGQPVNGRNIVGSIGSGPVIIIGAHYDTRLWADRDPDPANRHQPILGANDGASGVAVLLELARVLGQPYTYQRELRLLFLDAEDNGSIPGWNNFSLGTTYYVQHLDKTPDIVIILDMIGDRDLNIYYEFSSMNSAPDVMTGLWAVAEQLGYGANFIKQTKYNMTDDHTPFIQQGIRAVDVIDFDYPYWHTLADTLDKISAESLEKVGRVVQTYLEQSGAISPIQ